MLFAMQENLCKISASVKQAGINRATHYRWMNSDPEYKQMVEELQQTTYWSFEGILAEYERVHELREVMFVLSRRGGSRGYSLHGHKNGAKISNESFE